MNYDYAILSSGLGIVLVASHFALQSGKLIWSLQAFPRIITFLKRYKKRELNIHIHIWSD